MRNIAISFYNQYLLTYHSCARRPEARALFDLFLAVQISANARSLGRCARPIERIRVLEDSRAGAMWVSRAEARRIPDDERSEEEPPLSQDSCHPEWR